jgi:hypothetical protein
MNKHETKEVASLPCMPPYHQTNSIQNKMIEAEKTKKNQFAVA